MTVRVLILFLFRPLMGTFVIFHVLVHWSGHATSGVQKFQLFGQACCFRRKEAPELRRALWDKGRRPISWSCKACSISTTPFTKNR
jgi:hypothetical protein